MLRNKRQQYIHETRAECSEKGTVRIHTHPILQEIKNMIAEIKISIKVSLKRFQIRE